MCLTEYLTQKIAMMAPHEFVQVGRDYFAWLIETHGCSCRSSEQTASSVLGYDVGELAALFDCSESTMKAWLNAGVFGDPANLKPTSRKWRVPPAAVEEVRRALESGARVGPSGLIYPTTSKPGRAANSPDSATPDPGTNSDRTQAECPAPLRRRTSGRSSRKRVRRHDGWRTELQTKS